MDVSPVTHPIAFIDLAAQQRAIRDRLDAAIARVLDHGQYIMGPEVFELERRLARFCGARNVVTCASGTDALLLALMASGLHAGNVVIVPTFTFCATAEAVCLLGAIPLFADVDEDTFNLSPRSLKAAIDTARRLGVRLHSVISVDLFGQPCDYDVIEPIVREHNLVLICDAAQAFGATLRGRSVGTFGDFTTTSFFPAKPLGCYGDGGAVFTDNDDAAAALRSLRVHGQGVDKYDNVRIGLNGRLDTLQAAILIEKLELFPAEIAARQAVAARYADFLPNTVGLPCLRPGVTPTWAQYTVRSSQRDRLIASLKRDQVPTAVYYAKPLHCQAAYRHYPASDDGLKTAERLAASVCSLPMHPHLTAAEQAYTAEAVVRSYAAE